MPAGSVGGPMITKSFHMNCRYIRGRIVATNCRSRSGSCVMIRSTVPLLARFMAWPEPTTKACTSSPVWRRNSFESTSSNPEPCRLVVVAISTARSGARRSQWVSKRAGRRNSQRLVIIRAEALLTQQLHDDHDQQNDQKYTNDGPNPHRSHHAAHHSVHSLHGSPHFFVFTSVTQYLPSFSCSVEVIFEPSGGSVLTFAPRSSYAITIGAMTPPATGSLSMVASFLAAL